MTSDIDLTQRERDILKASLAMTDSELSERFDLAPQTLKNIRQGAYQKVGVSGPHALFEAALELGFITYSGEEAS